jgi:hypothetical protein
MLSRLEKMTTPRRRSEDGDGMRRSRIGVLQAGWSTDTETNLQKMPASKRLKQMSI